MPQTAYDRIMNLIGNDDFKRAANDIILFSENRKRLPNCSLRLPNYVFATAPGCGVSTHLRMFADLLAQTGIINPEGDVSCFEWVLDEKAFTAGGAFDRLLEAISGFTGASESFHGVIGVDVSAWQTMAGRELDRLLLLADDLQTSPETVFVYAVDLEKMEKGEELMRILSSYSPLETVTFEAPTPEQMIGFFDSFITRRGFTMEADCREELPGVMKQLGAMPDFDGLQTISNIVDEMIYHWMIEDRRSDYTIPVSTVAAYIAAYLSRYGRNEKRSSRPGRSIGFRGGY